MLLMFAYDKYCATKTYNVILKINATPMYYWTNIDLLQTKENQMDISQRQKGTKIYLH